MEEHPRRTRNTRKRSPARLGIASIGPARPAQVLPREEPRARLTLRALTASDRAEFVELVRVSHDHLSPWIPSLARGTTPEEFFDTELERTLAEEPARSSLRRIAECDGRIVGMFNLFNFTSGLALHADASWWVGKPHVRRGHATLGLRALLRTAFADLPGGLGLHRVMAMIAPDNTASLKLARAMGFRPLARDDHFVCIDGTWTRHECWAADAFEHALTEVKPTRTIDHPSLRSGGE